MCPTYQVNTAGRMSAATNRYRSAHEEYKNFDLLGVHCTIELVVIPAMQAIKVIIFEAVDQTPVVPKYGAVRR